MGLGLRYSCHFTVGKGDRERRAEERQEEGDKEKTEPQRRKGRGLQQPACQLPRPGAGRGGVPGWLVMSHPCCTPDPAALGTLPGRDGVLLPVADT